MIPDDLWLGVMHGSFRRGPPGSGREDEVRGEWAVTYHVTCDVAGFSGAQADGLHEWLSQLWNPFPGYSWLSSWVYRDFSTATHLATDQGTVNDFEIRVGTSADAPAPMQAAVMVIGRTNGIRRQVRRWLPGFASSSIDDEGRPQIGPDWPGITAWAKAHLEPNIGQAFFWTPVCWDADDETVREINGYACSIEWRTQRRRSLQGASDIVDI